MLGTESRSRRRVPESQALSVARAEAACSGQHGHSQAVAEMCDRLVTEFGSGPGGYLGPVDVVSIAMVHGGSVYDTPVLHTLAAKTGPECEERR
jgi:hypothetical protein